LVFQMTTLSVTIGVAQVPLSTPLLTSIDQTTGSSGCRGSIFSSCPTSCTRVELRSTSTPTKR
jgi:hypothetical protein